MNHLNKKDILKMVRHVFRRSQGLPDKRLIHPVREWTVLLGIATVIFIIGAMYTARLFVSYTDLNVESGTEGATPVRYNQERVAEVLREYQLKQDRFDELAGSAPAPAATTTESVIETEAVDEITVVEVDEEEIDTSSPISF